MENRIAAGLRGLGFDVIPVSAWREARIHENPELSLAVTDAPYRSVYGHRAKIEFLLIHGTRQVLVEAKRQSVPGSVDEKLAYVYLNALENIDEREYVLVIDGNGWRPQARAWIAARARETDGFYVFSPAQFLAWVAACVQTPAGDAGARADPRCA